MRVIDFAPSRKMSTIRTQELASATVEYTAGDRPASVKRLARTFLTSKGINTLEFVGFDNVSTSMTNKVCVIFITKY